MTALQRVMGNLTNNPMSINLTISASWTNFLKDTKPTKALHRRNRYTEQPDVCPGNEVCSYKCPDKEKQGPECFKGGFHPPFSRDMV